MIEPWIINVFAIMRGICIAARINRVARVRFAVRVSDSIQNWRLVHRLVNWYTLVEELSAAQRTAITPHTISCSIPQPTSEPRLASSFSPERSALSCYPKIEAVAEQRSTRRERTREKTRETRSLIKIIRIEERIVYTSVSDLQCYVECRTFICPKSSKPKSLIN